MQFVDADRFRTRSAIFGDFNFFRDENNLFFNFYRRTLQVGHDEKLTETIIITEYQEMSIESKNIEPKKKKKVSISTRTNNSSFVSQFKILCESKNASKRIYRTRSAVSKMVLITIAVHDIIIRTPACVAYHLTFAAQVHNSHTRVLPKQIHCHLRLFVCFSPHKYFEFG